MSALDEKQPTDCPERPKAIEICILVFFVVDKELTPSLNGFTNNRGLRMLPSSKQLIQLQGPGQIFIRLLLSCKN